MENNTVANQTNIQADGLINLMSRFYNLLFPPLVRNFWLGIRCTVSIFSVQYTLGMVLYKFLQRYFKKMSFVFCSCTTFVLAEIIYVFK